MIDGLRFLVLLVGGRDLSGGRRTNARWGHQGTTVEEGPDHAPRWAYLSHRKRAGVRLSALVVLVVLAYGAITDLWSTVATLRLGFWASFFALLWAGWEWSRRYGHRRAVVAPLAEALANVLRDDRYVLDPRQYLRVPVDTADRPTRVMLPRTYSPTDAQEKALVRLVARKTGLVAPSHTLELKGEEPFLEVRPAPAPRETVGFAELDVRAAVDAAPEGHPFLGFGPRDQAVEVDLDAESPHLGVSVATGGGKSVLARAIATQVLHHGGIVLVLDRKIESQLWAAGLPNVRYACSEAEIYTALMGVSGEIDRRFELVRKRRFSGQPLDREEIGPRLLVICEEVNALEIDLRIWWRARRESSDPAQCPALPILGRILAMGRAGRVHMIVIAQKLTCQAIGGTAARENLSTRCLGRATTSTWNMLAPECKVGGKYPRSSRVRGRVHVVVGDEATPTQVMYVGEDDARAYAMSGTVAHFFDMALTFSTPAQAADLVPALTDGDTYRITSLEGEGGTYRAASTSGNGADEVPHLRPVPAWEDDEDEPEDAPAPRSTLAEFSAETGVPLKALQNARDRSATFPEPVESGPGRPSRYRLADLEAWADARSLATTSTGGAS